MLRVPPSQKIKKLQGQSGHTKQGDQFQQFKQSMWRQPVSVENIEQGQHQYRNQLPGQRNAKNIASDGELQQVRLLEHRYDDAGRNHGQSDAEIPGQSYKLQ